ncbi:MAG: hypothetical protein ABIS03_12660 [Gemmatimonadaceae bacterium]
MDSYCIVIRKKALHALNKNGDNTAFCEVAVTLAVGGKAGDYDDYLMVISVDSHARLEAVVRQLILHGLKLSEHGRFADFAIVHGKYGLALDCDWLIFEHTEAGGRVSFRKPCEYIEGLADFTASESSAWIDQVGHGFMVSSDREHDAWIDFGSGRMIVSLKP